MGNASGSVEYNAERNNLYRLERLIHKEGTEILRRVLEAILKPEHLQSQLQKCSGILRKKCNIDQENVLYPSDGSSFSAAKSDISLLTLLLRTKEFSGISAPSTGWGRRPPSTDTKPNADISRIIYYRNKLSHMTDQDRQVGVTDDNCEKWWDEIKNALARLAKCIKLGFQADQLEHTHVLEVHQPVKKSDRENLKKIADEVSDIWTIIVKKRQETRQQLADLIEKVKLFHTNGNKQRKWGSGISIGGFCACAMGLGGAGLAVVLSGGAATPVVAAEVATAISYALGAGGLAAVSGGTLEVIWANDEERKKTKSVVEEVNNAVKSENVAAQMLKGKMDEFEKIFRMLKNKWKLLEEIWNGINDIKNMPDMKRKVVNNKMTVEELIRETDTFINSVEWNRLLLWHLENYNKSSKELEEKTPAALQEEIEKLYNDLPCLYGGDLRPLMANRLVSRN